MTKLSKQNVDPEFGDYVEIVSGEHAGFVGRLVGQYTNGPFAGTWVIEQDEDHFWEACEIKLYKKAAQC